MNPQLKLLIGVYSFIKYFYKMKIFSKIILLLFFFVLICNLEVFSQKTSTGRYNMFVLLVVNYAIMKYIQLKADIAVME